MPHECTDCGRAFDDGSKEMLSGCPDCGGTTFQFRPGRASPSGGSEELPEPPEPEVEGVARTVGNAASAVRNLVTGGRQSPGRVEDAGSEPGSSADDPAGASGGAGESAGTESGERTVEAESEVTGPSSPAWPENESQKQGKSNEGQQAGATVPEETHSDIVEAAESDPGTQRDRPPVPDTRPLSMRSDDGSDKSADTDTGVVADPNERPSMSELRAELNDQFESIRVVEPGQYELNLMELYDREEYIVALREDGKYTIQLPERWEDR